MLNLVHYQSTQFLGVFLKEYTFQITLGFQNHIGVRSCILESPTSGPLKRNFFGSSCCCFPKPKPRVSFTY